jgi:hypothetical protein
MFLLCRAIALPLLAGLLAPSGCSRPEQAQHPSQRAQQTLQQAKPMPDQAQPIPEQVKLAPDLAKPMEVPVVQSPIRMEAEFEVAGQILNVSYKVMNGSSEAILVLDRMWDKKAKAFNPNWAYVEIRGNRALVKRVMEAKPLKMVVEHPPVPYGREVKPGERLEGKFALTLPLAAVGAYDFFLKPNAVVEEVEVTELGFMLAWTTKPSEPLHPSMQKVTRDGEELQPFTYVILEPKQRFVTSEPRKIQFKGLAKRVPER